MAVKCSITLMDGKPVIIYDMLKTYRNLPPHRIFKDGKPHTVQMFIGDFVPVDDVYVGTYVPVDDIKAYTKKLLSELASVCASVFAMPLTMDDIRFMWCEEYRIMCARVQVSSNYDHYFPMVYDGKLINNGLNRNITGREEL